MNCLIELHYLPSLHYFSEISKYETIILEKHEHFQKQSYRSRCCINTSQGKSTLIVPLTSKHGKTLITEVRIDHSKKWANNHWRAIQSAYGKAPFFEHYTDALHTIIFKHHTYLYDYNYELLTMCLKWLRLDVSLQESLSYEKSTIENIIDLRNAFQPKTPSNVLSALPAKPYPQVFGNTFVEGLSVIDLVFCTGPLASTYL